MLAFLRMETACAEPGRPSVSRADIAALALIAAPFAIGWALVAPRADVPIMDDYAYAWSVEHLLKSGQLLISDRSSIYPIFPILWGALFARIGGFSFVALRLSTVVLAVVGCWAIYLLLRELAFTRRVALIGALTVALYPVYFAVSFSFMTDTTLVALSAIALYYYVSGIRRDRPSRLWLGALFATLAFLTRQVAAVLPIAALAAADRQMLSRSAIRRFWVPVLTGGAIIGVLWLALPVVFGHLPVIDERVRNLRWWFLVPTHAYLDWNVKMLWIVTFPLAPLLLARVPRRREVLLVGGLAILLWYGARFLLGVPVTPLINGQIWSLQEILVTRGHLPGDVPPSAWSNRVTPVLTVIGAVVLASFLVGLPSLRRIDRRAVRVVVAAGLLHFVFINLIWAYYDRYYMVMMPTCLLASAAPLAGGRLRTWVAVVVLAVWGGISITGTRDMLMTSQVCADLTRELEEQGVPPFDIDAGYALNGWRLYNHPELLPADWDLNSDVPSVNSDRQTPYRIVAGPQPGYDVLKVRQLPAAWWQVTDRVYVVRQRASAP
jgi:4-amino-4-deoxy-L-arabinose transferase-like glycosyltransferase